MKKLYRPLLAVLAALFVAGCGRGDTITSYPLSRVEPVSSNGRTWLPLNPIVYKIQGNVIVSKTASFLDKYENCTVLDLENWQCSYRDDSGKFGFRDGDYWEMPSSPGYRYVGRLEYYLINCRWQFDSSLLDGVIGCPLALVFGS